MMQHLPSHRIGSACSSYGYNISMQSMFQVKLRAT